MRILLAFFPLDDMGGLTNNNENLAAGLHELGHQVETKILLPREDIPRNGIKKGDVSYGEITKLRFDQRGGYSWPREACIPYRGRAKKAAIATLKGYDLIIWQIPVPTMRKENRGNADWVDLYYTGVPQVAYIHDGNFQDAYPWLSVVADTLNGVGCVNHAALHSARNLSVTYSLTPSPQKIRQPDLSHESYARRTKGFLSLQTFKAWKHVPELVQAVPHTKKMEDIGGIECHLAGKGIDYYYLTSKDKCKWPGAWEAALNHGMQYHGVITNDRRDQLLNNLTCLVDPSWSKKYAKIGDHYNRVTVEAVMCGAVPIVRPLGISTSLTGKGEVFRHGENCICIPQNVGPEGYGQLLSEICHMPYELWHRILSNAAGLLPLWDRVEIAKTFLDLARGEGEYRGETSFKVDYGSISAMKEFFNA